MSETASRTSESPFVDFVWQVRHDTDGEVTVTADGTWDIVFGKDAAGERCLITGPNTRTVTYTYSRGQTALGIRFRLGTYLPGLPAREVINVGRVVPVRDGMVVLGGLEFTVPTFEMAEAFAAALHEHGLLAYDPVVDDVLRTPAPPIPPRTVQRHFALATGLPFNRHQQIARAQHAAALLRRGTPLREVAHDCGYYDQAHMNRALKQILGVTPRQLRAGVDA